MLQSMTGFGKSEVAFGHKSFAITIKSVNSKTADFTIKLPGAYREKENDVRSLLISQLQRGKVDFYISTDYGNNDQNISVNQGLFSTYFNDLKKIAEGKDVKEDTLFSLALKMPNIYSQEKEQLDEDEWIKLSVGIQEAIQQLIEFRKKEGSILENELVNRVSNILSLLENIKKYEGERIDNVKSKLESQLAQYQERDVLNRDRFEQELIFYFEKLDITEEKVRLLAHCNLFNDTVNEQESQGRKLGFISQEMGREINTIGSKANHAKIQQTVVEMKDELEKIKEQLFNIL